MVAQLHGTMLKMENFQKLHELKKDLIGVDNLVVPGRVSTAPGSGRRGWTGSGHDLHCHQDCGRMRAHPRVLWSSQKAGAF